MKKVRCPQPVKVKATHDLSTDTEDCMDIIA